MNSVEAMTTKLCHVEEALMWLNKRIQDRAERGVLGTNEK